MDGLIEKIKRIEELSLPNGVAGAVWLDDVIETIKKHYDNENEQLRFLINKFQTPKGNYLIELLMAEKERKDNLN